VSTAIGLLGLPRYYQERDKEETRIKKMCETTRSMLWDIIIHFIGFLLLAAFLGSMVTIWSGGEAMKEIVCLVTSTLALFYTVFCLSGRGVQILTAMTTTMSRLDIGWKGINIHFNPSNNK
jgi:uncharacterized membrane protein